MFDFITQFFDEHDAQKRKMARELELRQALQQKMAQYRPESNNDDADYTEIDFQGRKLRVPAEHITLSEEAA